jgi:hypothetical protein
MNPRNSNNNRSNGSKAAKIIKKLIFTCQLCLLAVLLCLILVKFNPLQAAEVATTIAPTTENTSAQTLDWKTIFEHPASQQNLQQLAKQVSLSHYNTQGQFTQTRRLAVLKRPLISSGTFAFNPDLGMIWHQQSPFTTTMVMQQQQLTTIDSQGNILQAQSNSRQKAHPLMQQIPQLMQHLLSGDLTALQADFKLFYLPTDTTGTQTWTLGLIAKDDRLQQALGKIILQGQQQVSRIVMLSQLQHTSLAGQKSQLDITDIIFTNVNHQPLTPEHTAWFKAANINTTAQPLADKTPAVTVQP